MTFDYAENYWRERLAEEKERMGAESDMIGVAVKAFEVKRIMEDCCSELRKEILRLKAHKDPIVLLTNYVNKCGMNEATTSFNVDNCRVTIIAERKGE